MRKIMAQMAVRFALVVFVFNAVGVSWIWAADLESAHLVYAEKFASAKEGVHRDAGLLFLVVEIADANKLREGTLQGRCLLRTLELLRQHASDQPTDDDDSQAKDAQQESPLLRQFPFLLAECRQANPRLATRNIELKDITSRVLVNKRVGTTQRYVTALAQADFEKQVASAPPNVPAVGELLASLRERMAALREDKPSEAMAILLRCGAVEDALNLANEKCWLEFSLSSFGSPRWDSVELYERWQTTHDLLSAPSPAVRDIRQVLRDWPGFPPALRSLSRKFANEDNFAEAVNIGLLAQIDEAKGEDTHRSVLDAVERWANAAKTARGLSEYSKLLSALRTAEFPAGFGQPDHPSTKLVIRSWRTCGHLNIPSLKDRSQVNQDERPKNRLATLKGLGNKSKQFHDRLTENPLDASNWEAMGQALSAADSPLLAVPFFTQSLRLDPDRASGWLGLSACYQHLGHDQLRRGAALSALLRPSISVEERSAALAHLQASDVAITKPSASEP